MVRITQSANADLDELCFRCFAQNDGPDAGEVMRSLLERCRAAARSGLLPVFWSTL